MPTKKDEKKKEKKPRGRPRKVKKEEVKQKQTQKQVVIVNVEPKKRGRPRKQPTSQKLSLLPPTLIRLNQPPVPLPQQPTLNVVRESVKPVGSESVINTLQQQYQQDYDRFQEERLAAKLFETAMKKEGRSEELYPNTPHRDELQANTPVSQGVMYAEVAPTEAIAEAEARQVKKVGRPKYTPEQRAEADRLKELRKQEKKQAGLKQP